MTQPKTQQQRLHERDRRYFGIALGILQIIIVVFYGFFVKVRLHTNQTLNSNYYPMYQDVNVMMLIGFGYLMTFIKWHSWSSLAYTFFINAIVVQLYFLFSAFWSKVFHGGWGNIIELTQIDLTAASYCVASVLIALGAVVGKMNPIQILIMSVIQCFGYAFNQKIIYDVLQLYDAGGSTAIHTFGAFTGLTIAFIIGKQIRPYKKIESSYSSNIFSFIGTLFLWMYWPSFNAGFFPQTPYQKSVIIVNTVVSLTGSCLSTFVISSVIRQKFHMDQILNASLAGGVIIGAACGLITNPAASLTLGIIGGVISTLGYIYLTQFLEDKIGLHDSCGINNLHAIPGVLGGLASGVVIASYGSSPINDLLTQKQLNFYSNIHLGRTFNSQGGIQVAGTFSSLGIGVLTGAIIGFIIWSIYIYRNQQFFDDNYEFYIPERSQITRHQETGQINLGSGNQQKMMISLQTLKQN